MEICWAAIETVGLALKQWGGRCVDRVTVQVSGLDRLTVDSEKDLCVGMAVH